MEDADLADKYDQMMRLADEFDAAGQHVRERARLGVEILRDPDVADSADLSGRPGRGPRTTSAPPPPASTAC